MSINLTTWECLMLIFFFNNCELQREKCHWFCFRFCLKWWKDFYFQLELQNAADSSLSLCLYRSLVMTPIFDIEEKLRAVRMTLAYKINDFPMFLQLNDYYYLYFVTIILSKIIFQKLAFIWAFIEWYLLYQCEWHLTSSWMLNTLLRWLQGWFELAKNKNKRKNMYWKEEQIVREKRHWRKVNTLFYLWWRKRERKMYKANVMERKRKNIIVKKNNKRTSNVHSISARISFLFFQPTPLRLASHIHSFIYIVPNCLHEICMDIILSICNNDNNNNAQ